MPPELSALLDKPILLAAILALGALLGMTVERVGERINRSERQAKWQKRNARSGWRGVAAKPQVIPMKSGQDRKPTDAADQLRIVMAAEFSSRPLLNFSERRVLAHLDKILIEEAPGWRAMGQVALGEILSSENSDAYWAINSKRVDILIVDTDCTPLHALEFQGTGHHLPGGGAAARDAVKKEALRKAGIGYLELATGDTPADLRALIRKVAIRAT